MRVLVTRPREQAAGWVERLCAQGVDACMLPLLDVAAVAPEPLRRAWHALPDLLMFVSPNAAAHFLAQRPADHVWPEGVLAAAPGPGTAALLRERGVPARAVVEPAADAAQFDSESLWQQLRAQDWQGRSVLVVRGDGGRDWFADTLRAHGAQVDFLQAYRRGPPLLSAHEVQRLHDALGSPRAHCWLLSSSEAIGHLPGLAPQADWATSRAVATHARIAQTARTLGFGEVYEVAPHFDAVLAALAAIGD
jgi:uroporphyrinogen-III synthase